ncbi:MAG: hypothetical protein ACRCUT_07535 [Spirochaetota bacterium]
MATLKNSFFQYLQSSLMIKKYLAAAFMLLSFSVIYAAQIAPADCYGRWKDTTYVVTLNRNYTASVVIYVNPTLAYVFGGVFTVEKDNKLRISISEMKSCPRGKVFTKSGFTKIASSRFVFSIESKNDRGKALILRPREVVIDGNDSAGYFDKEMVLRKM